MAFFDKDFMKMAGIHDEDVVLSRHVKESGPRFHNAFGTQSTLQDQRFVRKPSFKNQLPSHTTQFQEAMEVYLRSPAAKQIGSFDIRGSHSWDEVVREAIMAAEAYSKKDSQYIRKIGRYAGDHGDLVFSHLQLIPNENYISILCGGLKIIFGAARRMSLIRGKVLKALGDVPDVVTKTQRCLEIYRETDPVLQDLAVEVYLAILVAIGRMVEWLTEDAGWRQIKAILTGPQYEGKLEHKISDMHERLEDLRTRSNELMQESIVSIKLSSNIISSKMDEVQAASLSTHRASIAALSLTGQNQLHLRQIEKSSEECRLLSQAGVDAQNSLKDMLKDGLENAKWRSRCKRLKLENKYLKAEIERHSRPPSPAIMITSQRLSVLLGISSSTIVEDLEKATRTSTTFEKNAQARACWLLQCPRFKSWLASEHSELLLVDGNSQGSAVQKTSAMTVLSAMLVNTLMEDRDIPVITLPFFCGLHTAPSDSLKGPQGILRGLLSFLLSRYDFDTCKLSDFAELDHLRDHDVYSLCRLFETLLRQLPQQVVIFCIIDGISLFETSDFREDLCHEVETLGSLTRDHSIKAVFKLLITSPVRSIYIGKRIPKHDHLTVPRGVNGRGVVLTSRRVEWQVNKRVNLPECGTFQESFEESEFDITTDGSCVEDSEECIGTGS